MKIINLIYIPGSVLMFILSLQISFAQCEPDTINCKDINQPGEICPLILPDGVVNQSYKQVFTVIPPYEYTSITFGTFQIAKIVIDNIGNLPPGLNYETNSDTFFVDTAYCISLFGIPTQAGIFDLEISVIPFVYLDIGGDLILFESDPVVDDTSLTIIVREPSGLDKFSGKSFALLESSPNPFRSSTRIGFYSGTQAPFELKIYNLIGKLILKEHIDGSAGLNYFIFDGRSLQPGTYLCNISGNGQSVTQKIVKLE
jgi:hypothetical protein